MLTFIASHWFSIFLVVMAIVTFYGLIGLCSYLGGRVVDHFLGAGP